MRRSHRKFTSEPIDPEVVQLILRAGLMSPTSKGQLTMPQTLRNWPMQRISAHSSSRGHHWLWSCWVTLCRTIAGWKMAALPPLPCSCRLKTWDWVLAGHRCAGAAFLTEHQLTPSFRAFSAFLRICRVCACLPLAIKPTSGNLRMRTA